MNPKSKLMPMMMVIGVGARAFCVSTIKQFGLSGVNGEPNNHHQDGRKKDNLPIEYRLFAV